MFWFLRKKKQGSKKEVTKEYTEEVNRYIREHQCKNVFNPEYVNGKWTLKCRCVREMDPMHDITYSGCGEITVVTEENLTSGSSLYRDTAYFGFYCQSCGMYHILREFDIPEDVKDRVFQRDHPERETAKIIPFPTNRKKV